MKTFAAVGYLFDILSCSYYGIKNYRFCRFNNKIEALVKGCNILHDIINEQGH